MNENEFLNDTLNTIQKRYSCRGFSDKQISSADIRSIGMAGIMAPSAMNRQGWHVTLVNDRALISEIEAEGMRVMSAMPDKSAYERIKGRGGKLFYDAQAVAFIAVKDGATNRYAGVDLGIVAQNISLAATSLGIDNCHCGMVAFCFAGGRADEFKKKLQIPDDFECNYGVLLGYGKQAGTPHTPDEAKLTIIE